MTWEHIKVRFARIIVKTGPGEPSIAHKVDEYCEVSKLQQCVELYAGLIEDWANIQSTAAAQHTNASQ
ncbi:Acetylornithine deacetylase [Pseudomonas amygdali pv. sesami]|nr:Acetylornithine deacetylase [Pseudomonas amygdali pv. sesami]